MHLVASVRPSVRLFVLSRLNQFKVFVCVSVISGRMRIIVQMRSICVFCYLYQTDCRDRHQPHVFTLSHLLHSHTDRAPFRSPENF